MGICLEFGNEVRGRRKRFKDSFIPLVPLHCQHLSTNGIVAFFRQFTTVDRIVLFLRYLNAMRQLTVGSWQFPKFEDGIRNLDSARLTSVEEPSYSKVIAYCSSLLLHLRYHHRSSFIVHSFPQKTSSKTPSPRDELLLLLHERNRHTNYGAVLLLLIRSKYYSAFLLYAQSKDELPDITLGVRQ